jgi:hypothetical protein
MARVGDELRFLARSEIDIAVPSVKWKVAREVISN